MSGDQLGNTVAIALCLVLVGSALIARRLDAGTTMKLAVVWLAIFAGIAVAIRLLGLV